MKDLKYSVIFILSIGFVKYVISGFTPFNHEDWILWGVISITVLLVTGVYKAIKYIWGV